MDIEEISTNILNVAVHRTEKRELLHKFEWIETNLFNWIDIIENNQPVRSASCKVFAADRAKITILVNFPMPNW